MFCKLIVLAGAALAIWGGVTLALAAGGELRPESGLWGFLGCCLGCIVFAAGRLGAWMARGGE
jgi:hypothetical protein